MGTWDIIIIGGGPGGLQAGIAAASEGLKALLIEKGRVGGQIGQTPKLENSVFAAGGITGPAFAEMMRSQALAMGVEIASGDVTNLKRMDTGVIEVRYTPPGGRGLMIVEGHTAIIATGQRWREIDVPGLADGVQVGLARFGPVQAIDYEGLYTSPAQRPHDVAVYGGGPSAGQAILALADNATVGHTHALMRTTLNMPEYLAERIRQHPRVILHEHTRINTVWLTSPRSAQVLLTGPGKVGTVAVEALFLCNGLVPNTEWLKDTGLVELDAQTGRILTGSHVGRSSLETSVKGVWAIGDCREGSTARVGSAIGEGSMAITEVWTYFQQHPVCEICPRLMGTRKAVRA